MPLGIGIVAVKRRDEGGYAVWIVRPVKEQGRIFVQQFKPRGVARREKPLPYLLLGQTQSLQHRDRKAGVLDLENTADSVFCKEGSGYVVPWYESDEKMHIKPEGETVFSEDTHTPVLKKRSYASGVEEDKELMRIFEATYGKVKPRKVAERRENAAKDYTGKQERRKKPEPKKPELIIIDGYNLIFAWDELRGLSERDVGLARDALIRLMCSHTAFKRCKCIIVFDAYRRKENTGAVEEIGSVTVVYTKEGQTADAYIEKTTHERSSDSFVRVVSSDMQEQLMILGSGGFRVSAREFRRECECTVSEIKEAIEGYGS